MGNLTLDPPGERVVWTTETPSADATGMMMPLDRRNGKAMVSG